MNYSENFKKTTSLNTFIGTGNPNSKILLVGKEVATDVENGVDPMLENMNLQAFNNNCSDWITNIQNGSTQESISNWNETFVNNPLYAFKGVSINKPGHTWNKYQKLNNFVFDKKENKKINFQEDFFITEMSVLPSKTTGKAQKKVDFIEKLNHRKETFFQTEFIQDFPVVILACGNYISGTELCKTFNVQFIEEKGIGRQKFWIHLNTHKTKLVIHTRQLSFDVSDNLLQEIAFEIKRILN